MHHLYVPFPCRKWCLPLVVLTLSGAATRAQIAWRDASFADNGVLVYYPEYTNYVQNDRCGLIAQPDGKLLTLNEDGIFRYTADGYVDNTFGVNGAYSFDSQTYIAPGPHYPHLHAMTDDRIALAGEIAYSQFDHDVSVQFFDMNGTPLFPDDFSATLSSQPPMLGCQQNPYYAVTCSARTANNMMVMAGIASCSFPYHQQLYLEKRSPDAELDSSFGINGQVTMDLPNAPSTLEITTTCIAEDPQGRILVAGYTQDQVYASLGFVTRFDHTGTLDTTFGSHGLRWILFHLEWETSRIRSIALDNANRIVLGGSNEFLEAYVGRLTPDGDADMTFGVNGTGKTKLNESVTEDIDLYDLTLDPEGRILCTGKLSRDSDPFDDSLFVARLLTDGSLDPTFGANGRIYGEAGTSGAHILSLPDGRFITSGPHTFEADPNNYWETVRWLPQLDFAARAQPPAQFNATISFTDGGIRLHQTADEPMRLRALLMDASGRIAWDLGELSVPTGRSTVERPVPIDLTPGLYMVRFASDEVHFVARAIRP